MTDTFKFRFELTPVAQIEPWGEPGKHSLHWFGLTDGWQCLETSSGRLLEYDRAFPDRGKRWVEYPVARLFEDLLDIWPLVRDPVPEDIAASFFEWYSVEEERRVFEQSDDPGVAKLWDEACSWWHDRELDFRYLTLGPRVHLWSTGSAVAIKWDATGMDSSGPRWAVQHALVTVPRAEAQAAVESFCAALLSAMAERVSTIRRDGWRRSDCSLDVGQLVEEQETRTSWADAKLARVSTTDWDHVRRVHDELKMVSIR